MKRNNIRRKPGGTGKEGADMKDFLRKRSYDAVKMFLNQFGTAVFGFVLALAAGRAKNPVLRNITSVFAILFYLFLLYTMTWEIGFRDKTAVEKKYEPFRPLTGLWISLCANAINLILAVFISLGILTSVPVFNKIGAFASMAALLLEGMYTGLLANSVNGVALNAHWWIYFVITVPSMITCTVAYICGVKDKKLTGIFKFRYPESDRDPGKKHWWDR